MLGFFSSRCHCKPASNYGPTGLDADGAPSVLVIAGKFLGASDLIAVGWTLKPGGRKRIYPDLDKITALIESVKVSQERKVQKQLGYGRLYRGNQIGEVVYFRGASV